jgi:ABC-2 type transport system permease protein
MSLFILQLRGELEKLLARKRTYLGFGVFILVELLLLFLLNLPRVQRPLLRVMEEAGYPAGLSGLTLAFLVLLWSVFLLGSLYLALVAGDVVSKEVEEGTLRMLLCRPISRERLLTLKALTLIFYTLALCWFIALTALGAGLIQGGAGPLFVFAPTEKVTAFYEFLPGLGRYFFAAGLLSLCLLTIPALGFFLSCLEMKPAAATITTLSYFFLDSILKNIPFFESIRGWFITSHMSIWVQGLQPVIPWARILESLTLLAAVNLSLYLLARAVFARRDFKS